MWSILSSRRTPAAVFACLVVAAPTLLAGCGDDDSAGSGDRPLLVSINKLGTSDYFIDLGNGFEKRAEELGADSRVIDVDLDSDLTLTEMRNAISSGAGGVAITVPDQKLGPAVSEIAAQNDVPLVATNDTIDDQDGAAVPFIGYDNREMGLSVGEDAAKRLNEAGWVEAGDEVGVLSVEVQTLSVCQDRTDASTEVMLDQVAGLEESDVRHVPYDGATESALQAVPGTLTANPNVERWVVYACNDEGVAGALRALEQAGVPAENVIAVGLGAYLACAEWSAGRAGGFSAALFLDGADVGAMAAEALYAAATDDAELPESDFAPIEIVTPQNYEQAGVKC